MRKQYFVHNVPGLWFVDFKKNYNKIKIAEVGEKSPSLKEGMDA